MQQLKLPNEQECKFKCCTGIGRRVSIKLGKEESSRRYGTVSHFNTVRLLVELDDNKGEIRIDKTMINSVNFYRDDEVERKIRNEILKSKLDINVPSVFLPKKPESDGLD